MKAAGTKVIVTVIPILLLFACGGGGGSGQVNQVPTPEPEAPADPEPPSFEWETATPDSVGLSSENVEAAMNFAMKDGAFSQSLIIVKDGKIVGEEYKGIGDYESEVLKMFEGSSLSDETLEPYQSRDMNSLATSWSMAKSVTSLLFGIARGMDYFPDGFEESASTYLNEWENDDRKRITIKNILDMRSGLEPGCYTDAWYVCDGGGLSSGGSFGLSEDQLTGCINRNLAQTGIPHPWYYAGMPFQDGYFKYSNCDTMILGEIFFRATGKDIMTFAETYLFSELGIKADWWKDSAQNGQADGNYLTYCCIDATPRDFAKIGLLIMNNGVWQDKQIVPASFIEDIKDITDNSVVSELNGSFSYGMKFWTISPGTNCGPENDSECVPKNTIYSAIGFDGQYIMMDFRSNLIVVRNSLYSPLLGYSDQKKWYQNPSDSSETNAPITLPSLISLGRVGQTFYSAGLMYELLKE